MFRNVKIDLPQRPPRQFLSESFDAANAEHIQQILIELLHEIPNDFRSAYNWYCLFQEASCAISETHTILELAVHLDSGDKIAEQNLKKFDETILCQMLIKRSELMDVYLQSPWRSAMHADDNGRIERDFLYRQKFAKPEISHLQIQENQLIRDYRYYMNQAETQFQSRRTPLSIVIGKLGDSDADIRKDAFFSYWTCIAENEEKLQNIFDGLLTNRKSQAEMLKQPSYIPVAFAELGRSDYGEKECREFRESVLKCVVPKISELKNYQLQGLKTKSIKPWDANVWPNLMPQRLPANGDLPNLILGMSRIANRIHPSFGKIFDDLNTRGLIEVGPRHRKNPGAFCVTFQERRMPFVFGNFSGNFKDAMTLVHEFGHALHSYATSTIPNVLLRTPGLEFCEVASMGLEMLASQHFEEWWPDKNDARKAWAFQVFGALNFWPFMAMIDEWQHEVYADNLSTPQSRNSHWLNISRKYKPHVDWIGLEQFEHLGWFSRPHIFTSPFYYIDYGIAQLGAVQLWHKSKTNSAEAVNQYIKGLSLGAQRSLPELFDSAQLKLDFGHGCLDSLVDLLQKEIMTALKTD